LDDDLEDAKTKAFVEGLKRAEERDGDADAG